MKITFLGTGTSVGVPVPTCTCDVCRSTDTRDRRLRPSALLQWDGHGVVIDTSTDFRAQALRHEIARVDAVLFTHAHADHILGLDDLRLYNWRQGAPVPVYGNRETLDALGRTFWYVFERENNQSTPPEILSTPVNGPFPLLGREILPVPVFHGRMPILGYRVGSFAYLTDVSEIPESSLDLLHGLDVLVLNALRHTPHPTHFNLEAAVEQAGRIGAGKTYLTHMSHEIGHAAVAPRLPSNVELAYDGLTIEIESPSETEA